MDSKKKVSLQHYKSIPSDEHSTLHIGELTKTLLDKREKIKW